MKSTGKIAFSGITGALAIGLGFALAPVPNIELVTLTLVFGGFVLGPVWGSMTGLISWVIYSLLNPMGAPPPHFLVVQGITGALAGLCGAWLGFLYRKGLKGVLKVIIPAVMGLFVTIFYQLGINVASFIVYGSEETLIPFIIGGIIFSGMHIVANTLIFAILFPLLAGLWQRRAGKA